MELRACLETTRGAAARDFGCGQGGFGRAQRPQRAVRNEPTPATDKRPAARRVFAEKAAWLRCSSVEDPPGIFSFVAPDTAFSPKTAPLVVSKQALKGKCGAEVRRRKPVSRNSETQEWVLRTVYVRSGVDGEGVIKFLTVRNLRRRCRAWVAFYTREPCEMYEMVRSKQSQFGATDNQPTSTQAKIKVN